MNEKGFFTITAICFLLIVSFSIKIIQESVMNDVETATNFVIENELQNAADSALIEATEKITAGANYFNSTLIVNKNVFSNQMQKNISVQVYVKSSQIHTEPGIYYDKTISADRSGHVFMSVASCDSDFFIGKVYRRTFAYIFADDTNKIIHYMNSLTGSD